MFKAMRIHNFRTFRSLRVERIEKVNLITGKNGAGKTAFLEALFLNAGATNTNICIALQNFRGSSAFAPSDDSIFRNLFHHLSVAHPIELIAEWESREARSRTNRTLSIEPLTATAPKVMQSATTELVTGLRFSFRGAGVKGSSKIQWTDVPALTTSTLEPPGHARMLPELPVRTLPSTRGEIALPHYSNFERPAVQGSLFTDQPRMKRLNAESPPSTATVNAIFVLARYYSISAQLHQQLVDALKQKTIEKILSVARIVDDRVVNIVPLSEGGISEIYIDIGEPRLIPLPLMGAGFFNALNIAAATLSVSGGVALIDEIEDGIHYLAFPALARALLRIISETNTQVFVTTHSDEMIEAFAEAAESLKFSNIAALHFKRSQPGSGERGSDAAGDGIIRVRRFAVDDIRAAREVNLELR